MKSKTHVPSARVLSFGLKAGSVEHTDISRFRFHHPTNILPSVSTTCPSASLNQTAPFLTLQAGINYAIHTFVSQQYPPPWLRHNSRSAQIPQGRVSEGRLSRRIHFGFIRHNRIGYWRSSRAPIQQNKAQTQCFLGSETGFVRKVPLLRGVLQPARKFKPGAGAIAKSRQHPAPQQPRWRARRHAAGARRAATARPRNSRAKRT